MWEDGVQRGGRRERRGWLGGVGSEHGGGWEWGEGEVRWQPCTGPDWGGLGGGTQWGKP